VQPDESETMAPEDQERLHMRMLQSKAQASTSKVQRLRSALRERDQAVQHARKIMHKELAALEAADAEKADEAARAQRAEIEQEHLKQQLALQKRQIEGLTDDAQAEGQQDTTAKSSKIQQLAELKAAEADSSNSGQQLADLAKQSVADHDLAANEVNQLQAQITRMQSQVAGSIASKVHWESNSTGIAQQLADSKQQLAAILTSKQTADVNMAQVIAKWKDSLAQLRNQVQINAELQHQTTEQAGDVDSQMSDLKMQMKNRDSRIAGLRQRISEQQGLTGSPGMRGYTAPSASY